MEIAEWKKEIDALLSSGTITDSDIEEYISKHPEIKGRDVWYYISELTAPEECKGCLYIQKRVCIHVMYAKGRIYWQTTTKEARYKKEE